MTAIGFVLLTHSDPGQALTLAQVLSDLYGNPPIVCHHDFSQCPLDKSQFPANVRFVEPHFSTFWGCFSIVTGGASGHSDAYGFGGRSRLVLPSQRIGLSDSTPPNEFLTRLRIRLMTRSSTIGRSHGVRNHKACCRHRDRDSVELGIRNWLIAATVRWRLHGPRKINHLLSPQ